MKCVTRAAIAIWLAMAGGGHVLGADAEWPQFRGVNSSGVAAGADPPIEFGPERNVRWRISMGPGHSSPCVSNGRIYLTTFDAASKQLSLVCVDSGGGEVLWRRSVQSDDLEKGHPSFNPASSTPACDGKHVVAYFGSFGLVCYDVEGNLRWQVRMPTAKSFGGNATSPAIDGKRVFLYRGNYVDHYLLGVDVDTGEELWRVEQDEPFTGEMACTACPVVVAGKLIIHSARSVQAFDPSNGERLWVAKCATTATSTPIVVEDQVIVAAWNKLGEPSLRPSFPSFDQLVSEHDRDGDGVISKQELPTLWIFHRPEGVEAPMNGATVRFAQSDKNRDGVIDREDWSARVAELERFRAGYHSHGILSIPLESTGVVDPDHIRTLATQAIPEVPSPLSDGQYVYFVKNGGVLSCVDLASGDQVYRTRIKGRGTYYASPLIAAGKIYCIAGDGTITVLKQGDDPEVLAVNDLEAPIYATPAIVGARLYVRTHSALIAFEDAGR